MFARYQDAENRTQARAIVAKPLAMLPTFTMALLLALFSVLFTASTAHAHDSLVSSDPEAEQNVDQAPQDIELSYSGRPMDLGTMIRIVDAEDKNWAEGEAAIKDFKVTQPLKKDMPDGNYQVRWRVVSEDGHPISGNFDFSVGDTQGAAKVSAGNGTDSTTAENDPAAEAQDATSDQESNAIPVWAIAATGAGIVLVALVVWRLLARPRSTSATK